MGPHYAGVTGLRTHSNPKETGGAGQQASLRWSSGGWWVLVVTVVVVAEPAMP